MSVLGKLTGFAPNIESFGAFIKIAIWGLVLGISISFIIVSIRNRVKYKYLAEIFKKRQSINEEEPSSSIYGGKAGYFIDKKTKRTVFRIKYGVMPWQKIQLNKLPDPTYMIGNKVYYQQLNKDNLVQARLDIDWEGEFKLTPVEDDLKTMAMQDIQDKMNILNTSKLTPITIGFIVMGLIIVSGIVVFYFLNKGG